MALQFPISQFIEKGHKIMQTKSSTSIGFIGLGLIGGSIAKAIRQYYPDYQILAFDQNRETLALALQDGTIDVSCTAIDEQFSRCSYIFLCAPISYNNTYLVQLKDLISPGLYPDRCWQRQDRNS